MKKIISKSILLGIISLLGVSLITGNVFASYIVTSTQSLTARITLAEMEYTLYNPVSETRLALDIDGDELVPPSASASSYQNLELDYNQTLKIQRNAQGQTNYYDVATYTAGCEGKYDFNSYDLSGNSFDVDLVKRAIYVYTANTIKTFTSAYLYAWNNTQGDSSKEAEFPGVAMQGSTVIDGSHRYYKTYINSTSDRVIVSNKGAIDSRLQTENLTVPNNLHRATYNLVSFNGSWGDYVGEGSWGEYSASPTTNYQTTRSSDLLLCGEFTSTQWSDDINYAFEKCKDGSIPAQQQYSITLYLAEGTVFKAKWKDSWDNAPGYKSTVGSTWFKQNGSDNFEVRTGYSGIYTLWVKEVSTNHHEFVGAERVGVFS